MRLIEERRGGNTISYVYEPGSYVPLARLDADGERTDQGGLGTKAAGNSPASKTIASSATPENTRAQSHSKSAANDAESRYRASLNETARQKAQALQIQDWGNAASTGTEGLAANAGQAQLCKVYYFHTDQVGMPQELVNAQGQVIWQASYKTWGSTVAEEWEVKTLAGNPIHKLDEGDSPAKADQQQNLRFQGQYLDRDTGLHYNTFRYYDPDVGRFISPDPIGLAGGINLGSYAPNPISWIDPWGWACAQANQQQGNMGRDALANRLKNSRRYEVLDTEVTIKTPGHTTATGKTGSRRADIVVRDRKTGEIIQVEVKTGAAARDKTQLSKDAEISLGGGASGNTTWGSKKLEPYGIGKGTNTGPIRTIEVTVDPNTGKIL